MLIHSVTPAHMLAPQSEAPVPSFKMMNGSYLEGTDTPEGFRLSRIHSTDPAMYLQQNLSPGNLVSF